MTGQSGEARMDDLVRGEIDRGVAIITLNRPARLNALIRPMMARLTDLVADAAADPAVGCVVVTGAGRGFCAGGDLDESHGGESVSAEQGGRIEQVSIQLRALMEAPRLLHEMPKPTIAMVNGPVAGAGIGIAGACDLRFASESALFVSAFDSVGGSGDYGATWFWTKILGTAAARGLFFLGERISARAALAKGIYTRVFPDDELRDATLAAARRIASGPRVAWRYMKANLNLAEDGTFEAALDQEAIHMALSTESHVRLRAASDAPAP